MHATIDEIVPYLLDVFGYMKLLPDGMQLGIT